MMYQGTIVVVINNTQISVTSEVWVYEVCFASPEVAVQ